MSKLIIIRGLPGAGKSYYAKSLECMVVEADMFCMQNGTYNFDQKLLKDRFEHCEKIVKETLEYGADCAVVNTFVLKEYVDKYIAIATACNASYQVITIVSNYYMSIHNVPEKVITDMKEKWENIPEEKLYYSNGKSANLTDINAFEFESYVKKHWKL